jgi:hypothetical protein
MVPACSPDPEMAEAAGATRAVGRRRVPWGGRARRASRASGLPEAPVRPRGGQVEQGPIEAWPPPGPARKAAVPPRWEPVRRGSSGSAAPRRTPPKSPPSAGVSSRLNRSYILGETP